MASRYGKKFDRVLRQLRKECPLSTPIKVQTKDLAKENLTDALRECIQALPDRAREAITQRYFGGQAVQDIARDWDTTPDAISALLGRSRLQLKRCMGGKA